jgi:hypothetical protein
MPIKWKLFGLACILQLLVTAFLAAMAFINVFQSGFYFLLEGIAFSLMLSLAVLGINILNHNYPETPVFGKQKRIFNWLFLLNFLLLAFLFGLIISEIRELQLIKILFDRPVHQLPFQIYWPLLVDMFILVFQFIILFGLYSLRRLLYERFNSRQFEFEKKESN